MIIDTFDNMQRYAVTGGRLAAALEFLRTADLATLALGKHAIDGEDVFAIVNEYRTKHESEGMLEAHRRYIDLHFVVTGCEKIGYAPLKGHEPEQPYDAEKDFALYNVPASFVLLESGMCAVCYPEDLHMPGIAAGSPAPVRKVVVKVRA